MKKSLIIKRNRFPKWKARGVLTIIYLILMVFSTDFYQNMEGAENAVYILFFVVILATWLPWIVKLRRHVKR